MDPEGVLSHPCPNVVFAHSINHRHGTTMQREHSFQDRCFQTVCDPELRTLIPLLVGVFDGHDGERASEFCKQQFPDKLAKAISSSVSRFDQDDLARDAAITTALVEVFRDIDRMFTEEFISDAIAEREATLAQMPEGLNTWQMMQQYPQQAAKLEEIQDKITGGTTAVVAASVLGKLYVANCGDSRAVLCQFAKQGSKRILVKPLTVDHDHTNVSELDRLEKLGLDRSNIVRTGRLGPVENTRAIGDHAVKGDYRNIDVLAKASGPPVIPDPEVKIEDLSQYQVSNDTKITCIVLMTDGIYKGLKEIIKCIPQLHTSDQRKARDLKKQLGGNDDENKALAHLIMDRLREGVPRTSVASSIVRFIVRWHEDLFALKGEAATICRKMDDLTLQIVFDPQNIDFKLPQTQYSLPARHTANPHTTNLRDVTPATPELRPLSSIQSIDGTNDDEQDASGDTSVASVVSSGEAQAVAQTSNQQNTRPSNEQRCDSQTLRTSSTFEESRLETPRVEASAICESRLETPRVEASAYGTRSSGTRNASSSDNLSNFGLTAQLLPGSTNRPSSSSSNPFGVQTRTGFSFASALQGSSLPRSHPGADEYGITARSKPSSSTLTQSRFR